MRYRFTINKLNNMTDIEILKRLVVERKGNLHPYGSLSVRLKKIHGQLDDMQNALVKIARVKTLSEGGVLDKSDANGFILIARKILYDIKVDLSDYEIE